jgi:phosphoserine phosphatase RsbU/P
MRGDMAATHWGAIEKENQRLRRAVEELSILNDIAVAISSTQSISQIVESIVQKCIKHLQIEQCSVVLLKEEQDANLLQTMVRMGDTATGLVPYRLGDQVTGWVLAHQRPLLVNDLRNDARFRPFLPPDHPIRSLMSVPLRQKGRILGMVNVFNKQTPEGFTDDDQRLLSIIASQSAQVIESARLYEQEQTLLRIEEQVRLARDIQTNLLPKEAPSIQGYQVAGRTLPAENVGGDYFDFIPGSLPTRWSICLGDVSGKGLPAALLMANLQATIRGQSLSACEPAECIARSNRLLYRSTGDGRFATLVYGILDASSHIFTYCNAGHNPPYLISSRGEVQTLKTGGVLLGLLEGYSFEQGTVPLEPGDRLVLFSDGISEAMNGAHEEFGEARLLETLRTHSDLAPAPLMDRVFAAARRHAGEAPQSDDMTMVVVQRTKEREARSQE